MDSNNLPDQAIMYWKKKKKKERKGNERRE